MPKDSMKLMRKFEDPFDVMRLASNERLVKKDSFWTSQAGIGRRSSEAVPIFLQPNRCAA